MVCDKEAIQTEIKIQSGMVTTEAFAQMESTFMEKAQIHMTKFVK